MFSEDVFLYQAQVLKQPCLLLAPLPRPLGTLTGPAPPQYRPSAFPKTGGGQKAWTSCPKYCFPYQKKKKYSQRLLDSREKHMKSVCKLKRNQATKCRSEDNPIIFHFKYSLWLYLCPRAAQLVKNLPAVQEAPV